jgi:hypothetical protein
MGADGHLRVVPGHVGVGVVVLVDRLAVEPLDEPSQLLRGGFG